MFNFTLSFNELRKKYSTGIHNAMAGDAMYRAFGENLIDLPIQTTSELIVNEVFHPFYIFQVLVYLFILVSVKKMFSCSLWWSEGYIYYPIAIVFMSTITIVWTVYMSRKHLVQLRDLARSECTVTVHRSGRTGLFILFLYTNPSRRNFLEKVGARRLSRNY